MDTLIIVPFFVQIIAIALDEGIFHIKRGLPLWERIGHPIDTLTVLACLLFALYVPYSTPMLKWYITLAVFSCLMVTKDEFVHKHVCPASEHWLHALLFVNHPVVLTCAGLIWVAMSPVYCPTWVANWLNQPEHLRTFLNIQVAGISLFFVYQVVYWNFIWKEKKQAS